MQVIVNNYETDCASDVTSQYLSWSSTSYMPCNLSKCKESWLLKKKGQANPSPICNIEQAEFLVLLGVTFQGNGRFTEHIKRKLFEANKCLYVLRSLRKEGYNQVEIDHLFQSFVLPKIRMVYRCTQPPCLNLILRSRSLADVINAFFISYAIDIYDLLEKTDSSISKKISCLPTHRLCNLLPRVRESSKRLRTQISLQPRVNTWRFKARFINRLYFKYTFTF